MSDEVKLNEGQFKELCKNINLLAIAVGSPQGLTGTVGGGIACAAEVVAPIAPAIESLAGCFITPLQACEDGSAANVADGLFAIAHGLQAIAEAINKKG